MKRILKRIIGYVLVLFGVATLLFDVFLFLPVYLSHHSSARGDDLELMLVSIIAVFALTIGLLILKPKPAWMEKED